jgi:electron transfer flavoprotein beta subunit
MVVKLSVGHYQYSIFNIQFQFSMMNILVCVKQVLESQETVSPDHATGRLVTDPSAATKMNPFDEYAVEEALRIREAVPESRVDAVTVGPEGASVVVRRAMGMGADRGIHIVSDPAETDPFVTASLIAQAAQGRAYNLILAGVMAEDDLQGAVGPMIAAMLSLPWATAVVSVDLSGDADSMVVKRELEGGTREILEIGLPALLTIQSGINRPRYPSLSNILRAKGQRLESVPLHTLSVTPAPQAARQHVPPGKSRAAVVLDGTSREKAERLIRVLEERHLLVR